VFQASKVLGIILLAFTVFWTLRVPASKLKNGLNQRRIYYRKRRIFVIRKESGSDKRINNRTAWNLTAFPCFLDFMTRQRGGLKQQGYRRRGNLCQAGEEVEGPTVG